MRQLQPGTGLEGAPDIMLLMMAALMVAIVWLSSLSHETALPPIDLKSSECAGLGTAQAAAVAVTLIVWATTSGVLPEFFSAVIKKVTSIANGTQLG